MNKDRTIKSNMAREGQEEVFDTISRDCREKGFRGSAGFYMAVVEANKEGVMRLRVNTARMLPVEPWVCTDQVTGEYGTDKLNITPVKSNSNLYQTIFHQCIAYGLAHLIANWNTLKVNKDHERMMVDPMFMIVKGLR